MHLPGQLKYESFPDSAYAQELCRGFPDLRFAPDLERHFQAFHLKRARTRGHFFQLAIGLLAVAAAVQLTVLNGVPLRAVTLGWLGPVIPACLALALTSWSRSRYTRLYLPAARVLLPLIAVQLADEALYCAKRGGRNGIRVVDCYGINYSTGAFRRSA